MEKFKVILTKEEIKEIEEREFFFDDMFLEKGYAEGYYVEAIEGSYLVGEVIDLGDGDLDVEYWFPIDKERLLFQDGTPAKVSGRYTAQVLNDKGVRVEGYLVEGSKSYIISGDIEGTGDYFYAEYWCPVIRGTEKAV